jgi:hypothetical protein
MANIDPTQLQQILNDIGKTLQGATNERQKGLLAPQKAATYQTTILTNGAEDELVLTLILS